MYKNHNEISEIIKDNISVIAVVIVVPIMILLSAYSIRGYFSALEQKNQFEQELVQLRSTSDTAKQNIERLQENIDNYNEILGMIVPEKEDYFSIIFALEKLSQDTGFTITRYDIILEESTTDKLSLSVEGSGDIDSFLNFLRDYQFNGNRLITNEKIELSDSNEGRTRLSLNFYHKALTDLAESVKPISQKDISLIQNIEQKVTISVKEDINNGEPVIYDTKQNPF